MECDLLVVGGGAAGFYGAINYKDKYPGSEVIILEKSSKLLSKVKVSGGGRCNVTNRISDPTEISKFYPRGGKELIGPFNRYSSSDTLNWFESRGVKLKIEEDGRVFPITNDSQTVIDSFLREAAISGIKIFTRKNVVTIKYFNGKWEVKTADTSKYSSAKLLFAPGSNTHIWEILKELGHTIIPPVPSLFTFNIADERLKDLAGITVNNCEIYITGTKLKSSGSLLITHWGLSGPAVLKLSALAARELAALNYIFEIRINFVPHLNREDVFKTLVKNKEQNLKKYFATNSFFLPQRLWEKLAEFSGIKGEFKWNDVSKKDLHKAANQLTSAVFKVKGKSTFKEEFVTCGGVSLKEINFKTMQSKILPGVFFAGEVMNIDGLTGGFNFQSAWTTAWIAAQSI